MNMHKISRTVWLQRILILVLFFILWDILSRFGIVDKFYVSYPSAIIKKAFIWISSGYILPHLWVTASETFIGFIIGLFLGVLTAVVFASVERLSKLFTPFMSILNAMPRIIFAPLIVLWFGLGFLSKIVMVIAMVYFIIFFNTYKGIKEVDPTITGNAKVLGASSMHLWQHVYFPSALTWIFTSIRTSIGFAVVGAIIGEYIGASEGLGYIIDSAQMNFDTTGVMAGLFILALLVGILDFGLQHVESHFSKWKSQTT